MEELLKLLSKVKLKSIDISYYYKGKLHHCRTAHPEKAPIIIKKDIDARDKQLVDAKKLRPDAGSLVKILKHLSNQPDSKLEHVGRDYIYNYHIDHLSASPPWHFSITPISYLSVFEYRSTFFEPIKQQRQRLRPIALLSRIVPYFDINHFQGLKPREDQLLKKVLETREKATHKAHEVIKILDALIYKDHDPSRIRWGIVNARVDFNPEVMKFNILLHMADTFKTDIQPWKVIELISEYPLTAKRLADPDLLKPLPPIEGNFTYPPDTWEGRWERFTFMLEVRKNRGECVWPPIIV